jgi:hypothetical protein
MTNILVKNSEMDLMSYRKTRAELEGDSQLDLPVTTEHFHLSSIYMCVPEFCPCRVSGTLLNLKRNRTYCTLHFVFMGCVQKSIESTQESYKMLPKLKFISLFPEALLLKSQQSRKIQTLTNC